MLGDNIYGSDIIKLAIEYDWRDHKTKYEEFQKSRLEELRKEWRSHLKPSFEDKYDEETLKQMFRDKLSLSDDNPFVEERMQELSLGFNKPKGIDYLEYIYQNLQDAFDEYYHYCMNNCNYYDKFLEDLRTKYDNNESHTQLSFEEYCDKNYEDGHIFWKYVETVDSSELDGEKYGPFDVNEIEYGEFVIGFDIPLVNEKFSSEISIIDISELNDLYKDKVEIFKKFFNEEPKIISFVIDRY